jgi:purine nucleoside permease
MKATFSGAVAALQIAVSATRHVVVMIVFSLCRMSLSLASDALIVYDRLTMNRRALCWLPFLLTGCALAGAAEQGDAVTPIPVKVMIVNMFGLEAAPWQRALKLSRDIPVPGLSGEFPVVRCSVEDVCQMTTSMGHANAAASVMAVAFSGRFDLRKTYFLIAGIAGIDPERGTIGSAAWARYAVEVDLVHEVDARDLPKGWTNGHYGIQTTSPEQKPKFDYDTEVFRLNEALLQRALALSNGVTLEDDDAVRAYRRHYGKAPANQPPQVIQCDTASGDTWWAGPHMEQHIRHWVRVLTDNHEVYCTTQQEDNAVLAALTRGATAGLVDLKRVAVLRSGSDFDQPYPQQTVLASMQAQRALPGAVSISADNLVRAGMPLVDAIVQDWNQWRLGPPPAAP